MPSQNEIKKQNQLLKQQQDILQSIQNTITGATASANTLSRAMQSAVSHATKLQGDMGTTARNTNQAADHANELGSNLKDAADSGISAMEKFGSSMGSSMKQASDTAFHTITQTMGAIGEVTQAIFRFKFLAGFSALFGLVLSNFEKTTAELRNSLGIVFTDPQVNNNLNKFFTRFENQIIRSGLSMTQVADTAQMFASQFGVGVSEAAELAFNIEDGARALNVSSATMANIVGGFRTSFDLSTEQAHTLSEQVGLLAAMNDVAPKVVLQDIAESTEEMARFSAAGVKNFVKTAIQARKLGMSIKDVANTMDGLLNFQDSLTKELQASVMLGRRINLNEARRAAFAGDTAGAMEAIKRQLQDVDLEGLDPLTLRAVADATNMSVSQFQKLVKGSNDLSDVGADAIGSLETEGLTSVAAMTQINRKLAEIDVTMRETANKFGDTYFKSIDATISKIMDTGFFEKGAEFLSNVQTAIGKIFGVITNKDLKLTKDGNFFAFVKELPEGFDTAGKSAEDLEKAMITNFDKPLTKGAALIKIVKDLAKQLINAFLSFFKIDGKAATFDSLTGSVKKFFTEVPHLAEDGTQVMKTMEDGTEVAATKQVGFFKTMVHRIKELFKDISEALGLDKVFENIGNFFKMISTAMASAGDGEGGGLFGGLNFNDIFENIKKNTNFEELKSTISTTFSDAFDVKTILDGFTKINFGELITKYKENIKSIAENTGEQAKTGLDFFKTLLGLDNPEQANEIANAIKDPIIQGVTDLAKDPIFKEDASKLLSDALGDKVELFGPKGVELGDKLVDSFNTLADVFRELGKTDENSVAGKISGAINNASATLATVFDNFTKIKVVATKKFAGIPTEFGVDTSGIEEGTTTGGTGPIISSGQNMSAVETKLDKLITIMTASAGDLKTVAGAVSAGKLKVTG